MCGLWEDSNVSLLSTNSEPITKDGFVCSLNQDILNYLLFT